MRKISADYIFPITSDPIQNGIITLDDDDYILEISPNNQIDQVGVEFYRGIICPGFINTHCHLELSHLRSQITEKTGIAKFIAEIISKRDEFSEQQIFNSILHAEDEMFTNGIVAIGDISNSNKSFKQKAKGNLLYHTFIEVFDLNPDNAQDVFNKALALQKELKSLKSSIVPHAPYTVSDNLYKLIAKNAEENNSILCIHNQESEAESEIFISKEGSIHKLFTDMGIDIGFLKETGENSLKSVLPKLPSSQKLMLVHNTFTTKSDINYINNSDFKDLFWCTCPNANLYIEGTLPNYDILMESNAKITIGTDSLSSNWSLSILDEIKTIRKHYPNISLQTLLLWGTQNGADFLGFKELGSFEVGKKPGLNLITDVNGLLITDKSEIQKLV